MYGPSLLQRMIDAATDSRNAGDQLDMFGLPAAAAFAWAIAAISGR
jgi:hypothetical protein